MDALPAAVVETRLLHNMHRAATTLLADAAGRSAAPAASLTELRDFLVAALKHHHESEDDVQCPRLLAADPAAGAGLAALSVEHDALDAALDALQATEVSDRTALTGTAKAVRDLVHQHLDAEEPVLFPALTATMTDDDWAEFSRAVIATAPPVAPHLNIGFFDEVGTPEELALVSAGMPPQVRQLVPAMRDQAEATLESLRA
jgi:hemerythrin-like domain-containing protein